MAGSTLLALSYGSVAVFAVAFVLRCLRIWRMPVHLRWELAPVPKEKGRGRYGGSYLEEYEWWKAPRKESHAAELAYMLREVLFLKALWEHNRRLWWFSFPFHLGLYLLAAAAGLALLRGAAAVAGVEGPGWGVMATGFPLLAGTAYGRGAFGARALLASRLLDPKLRLITTPVALLNLLLLSALFATGGAAILSAGDFPGDVLAFAGALLAARPPAAVPGGLALHFVVALVFLAYLPFSQMMHFVAKYFTYHQVRWEDRPLAAGSPMERELGTMLRQSPTWAAPHLGADGRKTWVDIASKGGGE